MADHSDASGFELSREELARRHADMQTWSNLELAQRWAEAAFMAGNLWDWAKHYLPDRDAHTMCMAFSEECLVEMDAREGV